MEIHFKKTEAVEAWPVAPDLWTLPGPCVREGSSGSAGAGPGATGLETVPEVRWRVSNSQGHLPAAGLGRLSCLWLRPRL